MSADIDISNATTSTSSDIHNVQGFELTFPWFTYPRMPFSGYYDEIYFSEMDRLMRFLQYIDTTDERVILHLTIGSAGEELRDRVGWDNHHMHYRQLIPSFLQEANQKGIKIISIVVSPNEIINPSFVGRYAKRNSGLIFQQVEKQKWELDIDNCDPDIIDTNTCSEWEIHWFRTMMPTDDRKRNNKMIDFLRERDINRQFPGGIDKYIQTEIDVAFTKHFYQNLYSVMKGLVERGSLVTCFNLAVFNSRGVFIRHNNCGMFKEIIDVFTDLRYCDSDKFIRSSFLAEWVYCLDNYQVYEIKTGSVDHQSDLVRINYTRYLEYFESGTICNESFTEAILDVIKTDRISINLVPVSSKRQKRYSFLDIFANRSRATSTSVATHQDMLDKDENVNETESNNRRRMKDTIFYESL